MVSGPTLYPRAPMSADFPLGFNADLIPAVVQYHEAKKAVLVMHPLGATHPNAYAAASRLRKQGYEVVTYTHTPDTMRGMLP